MKKLVCLLLSLLLLVSLSVPAFAEAANEPAEDEIVFVSKDPGEPGRPEETEWYFRVANGLLQKRLWSITYGYWLTDWITIGTVDP